MLQHQPSNLSLNLEQQRCACSGSEAERLDWVTEVFQDAHLNNTSSSGENDLWVDQSLRISHLGQNWRFLLGFKALIHRCRDAHSSGDTDLPVKVGTLKVWKCVQLWVFDKRHLEKTQLCLFEAWPWRLMDSVSVILIQFDSCVSSFSSLARTHLTLETFSWR